MSEQQGPGGPRSDDAGDWPDPDLVEYLVLKTSGLSSSEAVAPVLRKFVETAQIRVLDLVGVQTDAFGGHRALEPESLPGLEGIRSRDGDVGGVLSDDDIALVCGALGPNATALILVAEDRWAQVLADAARVGGGRVVGGERITRRSIEQSQGGQRRDPQDGAAAPRRRQRSRRQRIDLLRRRPVLDVGD